MPRYLTILQYWFDEIDKFPEKLEQQSQLWFKKNDATDEFIKMHFGANLEQAKKGEFDDWVEEAEGRLALIILFDQFSRHIYRETAQAYAQDEKALQLAENGIVRGHDQKLNIIQRIFFYLPFEHAEDKDNQTKSVILFAKLLAEAPENLKNFFQITYDYAVKHKNVIDQFGRFPHRNQILGRKSTTAEVEFLQQPGSSF